MKAMLVTGSRHGIDLPKKEIEKFLCEQLDGVDLVIHGAAEGVDSIIEQHAKNSNVQTLPMPAQWDQYKAAAGPKRNGEMVKLATCLKNCGWEIVCLAIPGPNSKGTYNCLKLMKKAGFHGKVYRIGI